MMEIGPRDEIRKLYNTRVNRILKYCAIGAAVLGVLILTLLALLVEFLPDEYMPLDLVYALRGSVGVCAIVFGILCGVLVYRVDRAYFKQR